MAGARPDPDTGRYELSALNVFTLEGEKVAALTAFLHPRRARPFARPPVRRP
jgi:hypothetical protein